MIHISKLDFESLHYLEFVKDSKGVETLNAPCGFDIEVSNDELDGVKYAFMYIWAVQIGTARQVYYGRTWAEFVTFCDRLQAALNLAPDRKEVIIYAHNLAYEFQFMRKHFEWVNMFALDERKPLKATTTQGIQFRCSYLLSGYSLAKTAENMSNSPVEKMTGDLDYTLVRTSETPLTVTEEKYVENDVLIVTHYIKEQIEIYGNILRIPTTNTGRVRRYVRNECYYTSNNHKRTSRGKFQRYRRIMEGLTLTRDVYESTQRAFQGGYTHASALHSGKVLNDVTSIDLASAYPSVMISELFPMSSFTRTNIESVRELEKVCRTHCVIFDVYIEGLEAKFEFDNYLSESKCYDVKGGLINNGRIMAAKSLKTTITEVDYDIIKRGYEWTGLGVGNVYVAQKGYLPKAIVKSILDLYADKTELKGVEGSEVEYMLSKGMLNSVYGMSVTNIVKDDVEYSGDDWEVYAADVETKIGEYNEKIDRFLFYPWGVWVTAYARRNLWTAIFSFGADYVYSDTDSVKLLNYDDHQPYIEWFNAQILRKSRAVLDEYGFDHKHLSPRNIAGDVEVIGVWDFEGTYPRFKTLGAKRYIQEERGTIVITVAGLGKTTGAEYLLETAGSVEAAFEMFNHNFYVPEHRTGKLTHTYIDHEQRVEVEDYLGDSCMMESLSSVHLGPCEFTLSIGSEYMKFLRNVAAGYVLTGIDIE